MNGRKKPKAEGQTRLGQRTEDTDEAIIPQSVPSVKSQSEPRVKSQTHYPRPAVNIHEPSEVDPDIVYTYSPILLNSTLICRLPRFVGGGRTGTVCTVGCRKHVHQFIESYSIRGIIDIRPANWYQWQDIRSAAYANGGQKQTGLVLELDRLVLVEMLKARREGQ